LDEIGKATSLKSLLKSLLKRLSDIEWEDFEVKEASIELPKSIWETVSPFANSAGGWIVLGIAVEDRKMYPSLAILLSPSCFDVRNYLKMQATVLIRK
jgi:predicted HTH transcriptional regulator